MPAKRKAKGSNDYNESADAGVFTPQADFSEAENADENENETKDTEEMEKSFPALLAQCDSEYQAGLKAIRNRWAEWTSRMKLYNNQKRNKEHVGSSMMFTTFNTAFASLYDDKLQQEWKGREEGDSEVAENLNHLSAHDYPVMAMPEVSYDWMWNTCFFSRACVDLSEFSRDEDVQTTLPFAIDPFTFIRDPRGSSVNGTNGRGGLRFFGYLVSMTKYEIEELDDFMHEEEIGKAESSKDIQDIRSNKQLRDSVAGLETDVREDVKGENAQYDFFVWYTRHKGKRVRLLVSTDFKTVHRYMVLENQKAWPVQDMAINPIPGSWDGVSIPDLVEDKQRHTAALLNNALKGVKFSQNPSYFFNANKVDATNIAKQEFGNLVPVEGAPADSIMLMPRDQVKADVGWILDQLDQSVQKATATPDTQQGVTTSEKRTLGELNLMASKVDVRYSLTAKLFSNAFAGFWRKWYWNYKHYFAELIDSKIVRIDGASGAKWRKLTKENIVSEVDPDVEVESKAIADARKFNELNVFYSFHTMAAKDPSYKVRSGLKKIAKQSGLDTDEVNSLFSKTPDEIEASEENEVIAKGKLVNEDGSPLLKITQDHDAHIEEHNKLPETPAKRAHIKAHNHAKLLMRDHANIRDAVAMAKGTMMNEQNMAQRNTAGTEMAAQQTLAPVTAP